MKTDLGPTYKDAMKPRYPLVDLFQNVFGVQDWMNDQLRRVGLDHLEKPLNLSTFSFRS